MSIDRTPATRTAADLADGLAAAHDAAHDVAHDPSIASGRARVRPALHELAGGLEDMAHDGMTSVRARARLARQTGTGYIRERPLPSMLLAAGAGAALVLIGGWLLRSRGDRP